MSELRKDPIIGRWVIVAPEKIIEPMKRVPLGQEDDIAYRKDCPFCPGNEALTSKEISVFTKNPNRRPNDQTWDIRVIPNNVPTFTIEGSLKRRAEGIYDKMSGLGAHEVIIETPEHNKQMQYLTDEQTVNFFNVCIDRINDLKKDTRIENIMLFKNSGIEAGSTITHGHWQLIATPIIPTRVVDELKGARHHFEYKDRCIFCDIINQEMSSQSRMVYENEDFILFCPFASRFPFEQWIMPKNHFSSFETITDSMKYQLAKILKAALLKLESVLGRPSYNLIIHSAPLKENNLSYYHWHIEIIPKIINVSGFEWGTGFYINPTPPEEAAKFLR